MAGTFSRQSSQVLGADELVENMKKLFSQLDPKQQGEKILAPALKQGAKPLRDEVVKNASSLKGEYTTGLIASQVTITVSKKQLRQKGRYNVLVGIKKKGTISIGFNTKMKVDPYYAKFVEYGTGKYNTFGGKADPEWSRAQKPQPFFRMALEATQTQTLNEAKDQLARRMNIVMKKLDKEAKQQKARLTR